MASHIAAAFIPITFTFTTWRTPSGMSMVDSSIDLHEGYSNEVAGFLAKKLVHIADALLQIFA